MQQLWLGLGIVSQGTLEDLVPQCLGVNNKGLEYLNFVGFFFWAPLKSSVQTVLDD